MDEEIYSKWGGARGLKGIDYQVNLLALFALEGLSLEKWKLSTENKLAEKFDDIVFQIDGDGDYLMQCKHKENKQTVSNRDFFTTNPKNNDFALVKNFDSFLKIRDIFTPKLLIICSNIRPNEAEYIFEKESTTAHLFRKVKNSYRLSKSAINEVKELLNHIEPSEEHLRAEFCKKLRFVHISDEETNEIINDSIADAEKSFELEFERHEFLKNIHEWFFAERGIFVKKSHVIAFLYETCCRKYSKQLNKHDIHFKQNYNIGDNKIINVISRKADFLNILKIHRSLKDIYDSRHILFINAKDGFKTTEKIIESFELNRFITVFICLYKIKQYSKIYTRLKMILTKYDFKNAVILSKEPIQSDLPKTNIIIDEIHFTDLTETCQEILLSKPVIFQGERLTIKQLIGEPKENIDSIIDQKTIEYILISKKIEIGTAIRGLGDIKNYYITRTFITEEDDELAELNEQDMCNTVKKSGKFIIISDGVGMGKTTFSTRLGCLIKETYPNLLFVNIDLDMFTSIFKNFQSDGKKSIDLEDMLKSKGVDFSKNNFEQNIYSMTDKLILMVDAVDGINPDYTSLVLNFLLQTSKRENISKIFVTTRPHLRQNLESFLGTKSYELQPFSKREQIYFLKEFWKNNLNIDNDDKLKKCEIYAEKLIHEICNTIGKTSWNFTGVPLQARMIAEIFEGSEDKEYEWTCCKNYLETDNEILEFPEKINITKLYDLLLEKKREIFIIDKCNIRGNFVAEKVMSKYYEDAFIEYHKFATRLLFKNHPKGYSLLLDIFERDNNTTFRETIISMGILQKFGDEYLFIHRTFADYFVAKIFWSQLNKLGNSKKLLVFFIGTVLVERQFKVIRAFFESILMNESGKIREEVFQVCGSTVDAIAWDEMKNINVLAEEGREYTMKLILEKSDDSKRNKLLNIVDGITGKTVLSHAIKFSEIVKFLLDKGADINKKDYHGFTVLHYALEHNKDLVEFLRERVADIDIADNSGSTALIPHSQQ